MATFLAYLDILPSVVILALAFYLLERFTGRLRHSEWLKNCLYLPFSLASIVVVQVLVGPTFAKLLAFADGGWVRIPARHGVIAEVLFALVFAIVWDVWQYWVHRWQHASPVLWQIHRLHHSDPDVNSSTQARNHPLNYLYLAACYAPMLMLFGVVAPHAVATVLMFRVWGFVNHANVKIGFGPLTSVLAGPQWHRIHHSVEERHLDKNFAAYFPFIDRMFGTYYRPAPDEYPATGLIDGEPESFLRQVSIAPFVGWFRMLRPTSTASSPDPRLSSRDVPAPATR